MPDLVHRRDTVELVIRVDVDVCVHLHLQYMHMYMYIHMYMYTYVYVNLDIQLDNKLKTRDLHNHISSSTHRKAYDHTLN